MIVWTVQDESKHAVVVGVFENEHRAIDYTNDKYGYHSWYQIKENWWRGYRGHDGSAFSAISHEVL